ncbi:hypothetical protein [Verrucosispora sioxanthis]|nr:hypothetical protein [Verrucosispora sioxanthis]
MISYSKYIVLTTTATFRFGQQEHIDVTSDEAIGYGIVIARPPT